MAQLTDTSISVNGNPINQFSSFSLSQGIFEHHTFRLICPAESIDGIAGAFSSSKDMIGATLTAQIGAVGSEGQLKFSGVVTQIETARFGGHHGDVIIAGYSPTIVLDSGPHCKSWEKKAVKNIAQDVLKHFPQNLLNPKISPVYGETLAYIVQYKETAWQFLKRLTSTYGEWLYYDGQKLTIAPPSGAGKAALRFGSNLNRFNIALQVRPADMQMMSWDYMNSETYTSTPDGIEGKAGLNDLGKHVLQASKTVYGSQPKAWNNQFLTNKKQQDDVVNIRMAMRSSSHVRFNGNSGHPGVALGGQVDVQGQNAFNSSSEVYGEFTVINVNHYVDSQGNYSNDFVAIPASIKMPPVTPLPEPHCETQSAIVTDNNDPRGLGRVRVKYHWMNGSEKSPWMRVTTPHAGGGKGMYFIPEVDEEIISGFEGDSATKPYIIGAVYHSKANNAFGNAGNDVKALQSRSGNKVILNDKDGSVFVEDKDGNNVLIDGKGNINVFSKETMTFTAGEAGLSVITMKKDGTIDINGKNITIVGTESVTTASGSEGSASGFTIQPTTVDILAKSTLNAHGESETNVSGGAVNVAATTGDTCVQGTKVNLN